jgi:putative spermidine/putrescine transport system permease protein
VSGDITTRRSRGLRVTVGAALLFLYFPLAILFLYGFDTEGSIFTFPPPGLTLRWFTVARHSPALWDAMWLSVRVATLATLVSLVLGSLAAAAVARSSFFGREAVSLLVVLPIALPGIITGIALRSAINLSGVSFSTWTLVAGHATFCVVVVYNNVLARLRRTSGSVLEASADLGASGLQTLRHVLLPSVATALVAGAMLSFALSFDEIIVTTFTAGNQETLPIWIFSALNRPRNRPVLHIAAMIVVLVTALPVLVAQRLAGDAAGLGHGRE